jgi:hypothetical protein
VQRESGHPIATCRRAQDDFPRPQANNAAPLSGTSRKCRPRGVYFPSSASKTRRAPLSIGHKYPAVKTRVGGSSTSCSSDIGLTPPAASGVFPEARAKLARRKTNDVKGTTLGNCGAVDAVCASTLTVQAPRRSPRAYEGAANRSDWSPPNRLPAGCGLFAGP